MRVALDTNILVYAESMAPGEARDRQEQAAIRLLKALPQEQVLIPVQVLGELFRVLTRKVRLSTHDTHRRVESLSAYFPVAPTTITALSAATVLCRDFNLPTWDAVILAVAAENGCKLVLSEDYQDGFTWKGITVANPFADRPHPLLAALL